MGSPWGWGQCPQALVDLGVDAAWVAAGALGLCLHQGAVQRGVRSKLSNALNTLTSHLQAGEGTCRRLDWKPAISSSQTVLVMHLPLLLGLFWSAMPLPLLSQSLERKGIYLLPF